MAPEYAKEHRRLPRKSCNYPASILIKNAQARGYSDVGFRGMVKNIAQNGVLVGELFNLNLNGLNFLPHLNISKNVKLIFYPPAGNMTVTGTVRRLVIEENRIKSVGIGFRNLLEGNL